MSCSWPENRAAAYLLAFLVACPPVLSADKSDDAEKALRQQRREVLQEAVKVRQEEIEAGRGTAQSLVEPARRLFLVELELAAKPADRLALCEKFGRVVKDAQELNEAAHKAGRVTDAEYAMNRAACLEDEVFLLRETLRAREDREGAERLRKLRLERREAYQGALLTLGDEFQAGRCSVPTMLEVTRRSLNADLETEDRPAARWALGQATVDRLAKLEEEAGAKFEVGRLSKGDHAAIRSARLTAEIDLQREKSGPRAERLDKFRRLLEERRDAARIVLEARQAQVDAGRATEEVLLDAAQMVLAAELPLAEKAADRIALLRTYVGALKKGEEIARARHEVGRLPIIELLTVRAARLEAEINLLRAERAAK